MICYIISGFTNIDISLKIVTTKILIIFINIFEVVINIYTRFHLIYLIF
jgi:hypothetical protein